MTNNSGDLNEGMDTSSGTGAGADDGQVHLEMRERHHAHDNQHVNLSKEEYTADEVARMIGTSLDVVMHAVRNGDLKAERQGQNVVCISHADVADWMQRRGSGV
ncbi:MAG: helix-turn-helix domain-containing protein [Chloroflexota bacterium]|nr:helix-turn-helix domain-containing protein [Chloroflexota bacterium]